MAFRINSQMMLIDAALYCNGYGKISKNMKMIITIIMIITITNFHPVSMKAYNKISDKNVLYDEPKFLFVQVPRNQH